jgi:hypothetical protein
VSTPYYQNPDPAAAPSPITPADSPGDEAGWSMVTPAGQGTAPYDIAAPLDEAGITAATDAAGVVAGAGIVYSQGIRQRETQVLLDSPFGFSAGSGTSGYDITAGWSGEPDESWDNNPQPGVLLETPVQGQMGTYPASTSTVQEGLQKYGTS